MNDGPLSPGADINIVVVVVLHTSCKVVAHNNLPMVKCSRSCITNLLESSCR